MPTLHLLRHAKSDWADPGVADHDRPLSARGDRAARDLAGYVRRTRVLPDLVLCSSARRTVDTLAALRAALPVTARVEITDALYEVDGSAILNQLRRLPDTVGVALVVGHNPGIASVTMALAGVASDPEALRTVATKYPTGGMATLDFEGSWRDLAPGSARLAGFVRPRDITG